MARLPEVDLFISNNGHHLAMCLPVVEALGDRCRCRVQSLCELRGLVSPSAETLPEGASIRRLLPLRLRRSPSTGRSPRPGRPGLGRRALRQITWTALLAPRLRALSRRHALAVLPNDAAFPFDRIARLLGQLGIPFLLLQEGIRFPLPGEAGEPVYGLGGAAAIAAWGAASAEHFREIGAPEATLHVTGSPRFDRLAKLAGTEAGARARARYGLPAGTLLLLSNPIDDLGYCTNRQKLQLVAGFLAGIEPLFEDPAFHVAIKLHPREKITQFTGLVSEGIRDRVSVFSSDAPLWDLMSGARAAVVMASTAGLEALLCGLPLGVLEIPGQGFQYDYVSSGAAVGLTWSKPMAPQVGSLLRQSKERQAQVEEYLRHQLELRSGAARKVADLILDLLARR